MRTINQIQADISKLEAELADVKDLERKQLTAEKVLQDIGWTYCGGKWCKPAPNGYPFKAGDIVSVRGFGQQLWSVRAIVNGEMVRASRIVRAIRKDFYPISNDARDFYFKDVTPAVLY